MRQSFTCILNLVLCFTCVYIGLTLLVLTMFKCDYNDRNQENQCKNDPKPELQCLMRNIDKQFDQENIPNCEFENPQR